MSDAPSSYNNPQRPIFSNPEVDTLALTLMTLTKELWVVKDRLQILETVLDEKGIDVSGLVDRYQPSPELQKKLDAEATRLLEAIAESLQRR